MERQYYVMTDLHFGHNTMWKCGYREKGFEYKILNKIDNLHKNEKTVFINFGDFAFYKCGYWCEKYFELTKGCKNWFIKGNHDKKTYSWWLDHGWDVVCEEMVMELYGCRVLLSHKPLDLTGRGDIDINIHGHLHKKQHRLEEQSILTDKHFLLSIEEDNYEIKTLKRICMNERIKM